jgi:hypothetical protein
MITLYWVYDLPNWFFGLLCIGTFTAIGLIGLPLTRQFARRVHQQDHSHNDIVGYYLAAVTVFYGITLGLVAVGTWNNYSMVQDRVDHEAQTIGSLYRDVSAYPAPINSELQQDLKSYVREVVDHSWPLQRRGIMPTGTDTILSDMQTHLLQFAPQNMGQQVIHAEAFKQFNQLIEARRSRLDSINVSLPRALWWMVIVGAVICIVVTFFFDMRSMSMHRWMTALMSGLLGLIIFLIATLDNPFRGKVAVGPTSIQTVYTTIMR